MTISSGAVSDKGRVRSNNEDYLLVDGKNNVFIIADGMGGHRSGEVASKMACDIIAKNLSQALGQKEEGGGDKVVFGSSNPALSEIANYAVSSIKIANEVIYEASLNYSQNKGMGTTLVLTIYLNNSYIIGWVGDSRAYLVRQGQLSQLTRDHSVVQEQIDKGLITPQQAETSDYKNVLTRALGTDSNVEPGVLESEACSGDYLLLCTDGLTKMLSDEQILAPFTAGGEPQEIADKLTSRANDAGGRDNVSVIVLYVQGSTVWDKLINSIRKL
jgi:serine/threonine protein phosphatase PrpC